MQDYHAQDRSFKVDDLVLAKNYRQGPPWLPGVITDKRSDTSFFVQLSDDLVIRCHPDQLRHRSADVSNVVIDSPEDMLTWPDISSHEDSTPH